MRSQHSPDFSGAEDTEGDLGQHTSGLQTTRSTKRLALCTRLAYHKPTKLLDRSIGAAGAHDSNASEALHVRRIQYPQALPSRRRRLQGLVVFYMLSPGK